MLQVKEQKQQQHQVRAEGSDTSIGVEVEDVDHDATYPHMLPKVMVPFIAKPGQTPRKVQIQRQAERPFCRVTVR